MPSHHRKSFGWLRAMYLGHYVQISCYLVAAEPLFQLISCFLRNDIIIHHGYLRPPREDLVSNFVCLPRRGKPWYSSHTPVVVQAYIPNTG